MRAISFFIFVTLFFLLSLAATDEKGQSARNLQKIKDAVSATSNQEAFVTEKVVHHAPPHFLFMLQRKHPHVYLEVIKIKEQVLVDAHRNKILAKNAIAAEHLYRVHADGSRSALRSRLILLPQERDTGMVGSAGAPTEHPDELDWFDRLALALHLDQFWPRLLFSLCAGFSIVALGFLVMHIVCVWLGYGPDNAGEDEYSALLDPNVRGPGAVIMSRADIVKSAKMETI